MNKKPFFLIFIPFFFANLLFADAAADKRNQFIECAKKYLGIPYVYGGTTTRGLDCSGFVMLAARDVGITLPRTAALMYSEAQKISDSERQKGDLIFFKDGSNVSHVAIYLGNNRVIHCISDGPKTGVVESELTERYWKEHYFCAGRIISASASTSGTTKPSTTTKPTSKKKKYTSVYFNFDGYFDWNFFNSTNYGFIPKGVSIDAEVQLNLWDFNPGLMVRYRYPFGNLNEFKVSDTINNFEIPICLAFHLNDYISFYAGPVLTRGIVYPSIMDVDEDNSQIKNQIFGIAGVSFRTPKIDLGSCELSLVQDISYTLYKPFYKGIEGYEALPTFTDNFAKGLTFSTGISVTLPF